MKANASKNPREFLSYVAPALLYVIFIFWMGSIRTAVEIPVDFLPKDKLNHFTAFGLLTLLCLRALRFEFAALSSRQHVLLAIATSSILGAVLELWQQLFPYRSSEFLDWVADSLGSLLAGLIGYVWLGWRARRAETTRPAR